MTSTSKTQKDDNKMQKNRQDQQQTTPSKQGDEFAQSMYL